MKLFVLILSFLAVTQVKAACAEIKICWEPYEPFQMKKGDKHVGIDFEILEAIAGKMSCKIKYEEVPWKRCLAGMESGEYDGAGSASKNPEREKFAHFTDAYITTANALFVAAENVNKWKIAKFEDITGFKDFKLATVRGYDYGGNYLTLAKDAKFAAQLEEADTEEQNFKKVAAGRVSGTYSNEFVGVATIKSIGLAGKVVPSASKLATEDSFFMFSKKTRDEAFVKDFNKALAAIKSNGSHQKILSQYIK